MDGAGLFKEVHNGHYDFGKEQRDNLFLGMLLVLRKTVSSEARWSNMNLIILRDMQLTCYETITTWTREDRQLRRRIYVPY